jgi:uncharacterized protein
MTRSSPTHSLIVPSHRLSPFMQLHRMICLFGYFLLVFVVEWLYLLLIVVPFNLTPSLVPLGSFLTLTATAFLFTALSEGRAGVFRLLRSYVRWRVGLSWYLLALLGIPVMVLLSCFVLPGAFATFHAPSPSFVLGYLVSFLVGFLIGGPLAEEVGWRGFALPRLQQRFGPVVGTLILGVIWGLYHLPGYLQPGGLLPFGAFIVATVALAVIITWVFNHTGGSLLLTMLVHASFNTAALSTLPLFASLSLPTALPGFDLVFVAVALLLILATRGHLSYHPSQHVPTLPVSEKRAE